MAAIDDTTNRGPGDGIVPVCNIIGTDGKQLKEFGPKAWNTVSLTESLGILGPEDTQFVSGEIVIVDAIDMFNAMAIHGDEIVDLEFQTPQKMPINYSGRIYAVDLSDWETKRVISLQFCAAEKIVSDQLKVSKVYRDDFFHEIAVDLYADLKKVTGKEIFIEPTANKGSVIIDNKSPVDGLNMICGASQHGEYKGADYIFYEQLGRDIFDGVSYFNFKPVEGMVDTAKNEPAMIYSYDSPGGETMQPKSLARIKYYMVHKTPNIIDNIAQGMYASTLVTNDLLKRQHNFMTFNYDESYTEHKHTNHNEVEGMGTGKTSLINNTVLSKRPQGHTRFFPKNYKSFDTPTNYADERAEILLKRNSQFQQRSQYVLELSIPGDSQRRVGEVVDVNIPALEVKNSDGKIRMDKTFSGRWLIAKIKHTLIAGDNKYTTNMALVKDSYTNPLPERKI